MPFIRGIKGDNTATGWSNPVPSVDTNIIYCSDSLGSDGYDGSQPQYTTGVHGPVKTLVAAQHGTGPSNDGTGLGTLGAGNSFGFRDTYPEWILHLAGDIWIDQCLGAYTGYAGSFLFGGRSATEPMVLDTYSLEGWSPETPQGTGVRAWAEVWPPVALAGTTKFAFGATNDSWQKLDYLYVGNIKMYIPQRDPNHELYDPEVGHGISLISVAKPTNWVFIEGCDFSYASAGILFQGQAPVSGITGHIDGTVLTVTVVPDGFVGLSCGQNPGAIRLTGSGVTTCYIDTEGTPGTGTGGVGTYPVTVSQTAASTELTAYDDEGRHSIQHQHITVRRTNTAYNYPAKSLGEPNFGCGMLLGQVKLLEDEENVTDHDGWLDNGYGEIRNTYNHGHYIHENDNRFVMNGDYTDVRTWGNICLYSSWQGMWQRPGGSAAMHLMIKCGCGIGFAYGTTNPPTTLDQTLNDIMVIGSMGYTGGEEGGSPCWGIQINASFSHLRGSPVPILGDRLMVAHATPNLTDTNYLGIHIDAGCTTATVQNSIGVDWPAASDYGYSGNIVDLNPSHPNYLINNIQITGSDLSGNVGFGGQPFFDPSRTPEKYDQDIMGGPGTLVHLRSLLRARNRDTWDARLTAPAMVSYFQIGFGISGAITATALAPNRRYKYVSFNA